MPNGHSFNLFTDISVVIPDVKRKANTDLVDRMHIDVVSRRTWSNYARCKATGRGRILLAMDEMGPKSADIAQNVALVQCSNGSRLMDHHTPALLKLNSPHDTLTFTSLMMREFFQVRLTYIQRDNEKYSVGTIPSDVN